MKVIFQIDPLDRLNQKTDSSLLLMAEAEKRGHHVAHYCPKDLSLDNGVLLAKIAGKLSRLDEYDVLLIRQDPPFNMSYLTSTFLLDSIKNKICILNNPTEIRSCPEKIFVTHFPDLIAETTISQNLEQIGMMVQKYGKVVLKPLYSHAGQGVELADERNYKDISAKMIQNDLHQIVAQRYLPEIRFGDKRILLVDGEPVGSFLRLPPKDSFIANIAAGGIAKKCSFSVRDQEICDRIGPELKKRGLYFVGIDVIGDYITEINVTSPTGIAAVKELNKIDIAKIFWDQLCIS